MSTPLPPFSLVSRCPKCGKDGGGPDVVPDGTHVILHGTSPFPVVYHRTYSHCLLDLDAEHLHRTCPRCGFGWAEACVENGAT
jgi:ribosomal protein S27AE